MISLKYIRLVVLLGLGALSQAAQSAASSEQSAPVRRVRVRVVSEKNEPLAGALVRVGCDPDHQSWVLGAESDAAGVAAVPVKFAKQARCRVIVTMEGYRPQTLTVEMDALSAGLEFKLKADPSEQYSKENCNASPVCPRRARIDATSSTSMTTVPLACYQAIFAD